MTAPARGIYGRIAERLDERLDVGEAIDDQAAEEGEAAEEGGAADGRAEGLWADLALRVDPAEYKPQLRSDVEVKTFRLRWGNDYAMIANPTDLLHYQVSVDDAEVLELMDGTRTVKDIVVERLQGSGDLELDDVADLVTLLRKGNFLTDRYVDTTEIVRKAADPVSRGRAKAREFTKTLSIEWSGAHRMVAWFYRNGLRFFFRAAVSIPTGLIALLGFIAFISVHLSGRFELGSENAALQTLVLLGMDYMLTFIHELGHAVVLVHYGRKVKSAGFMIYFGSPAFFVESADGLMLERRQRIVQSFAGPYAELVVSGIAALFLWAFPDNPIAPFLYTWALLNYFVVFLNLIPLLELDGYWIFSDLIQVPDLRPRSLQFIRYDLWRKLRSHERITKQEGGLALYGFLGVAFTILSLYTAFFFWETVFGGLISELWNGGLSGKVLLLALALFLAGPLLRGLITLFRSVARKVKSAVDAIRFKLQTRWRVEAATLIDGSPMFDDLPEDVLSDLAGRVTLRRYPAGKPVFRQGDRPQAFYVVRSGSLQVIEEDTQTGKERVIRTLGRGDTFGELGLIDGGPRSATVRPVEETQLFEVDESTFDRLLANMVDAPDFAPTLQRGAELQALGPFAGLSGSDVSLLLDHGAWVNVPPGATIITQGEEGDAFYVVGAGQLEVFQDDEAIGTMGPGSHFGEIALLMDVPRTASVVAKTPTRLFRLDREGFEQVVARSFRRGTLSAPAVVGRTAQH
ncbi:MAG: cyclic nucleotide-binding domain-containing protein [Actinomycetota bacterium]